MMAIVSAPLAGICALGCAALFASVALGQEPFRKKVLVIGIDGCRPDAPEKARAPHLHGLMREGAFSDQAQTAEVTISGPGWSSMLTGVWPEKHGVRDNDFKGARLEQYPHFFKHLKQSRPRAFTASIVNWAPINERIVRGADWTANFKQDRLVAAEAERVLRDLDPDALFIQFDEVDAAGHRLGFHPSVRSYLAAIERTDEYIGRLLKAIEERKTHATEDWLVMVSSDHGGAGTKHGRNIPEDRTVFVIISGQSARKGPIEKPPGVVDVAATALAHLGVALDPRWGLDGKPVGVR